MNICHCLNWEIPSLLKETGGFQQVLLMQRQRHSSPFLVLHPSFSKGLRKDVPEITPQLKR